MADTDPKPPTSEVKTTSETLKDAKASAQEAALSPRRSSGPPSRAAAPPPSATVVEASGDGETEPEDDAKETPAQAEKRQKALFRDKARKLYDSFRSPDVNLAEIPASILAAHCMSTLDKPEHMGRTEAIAWVNGFKQQYPIVWSALRVGHMTNFVASMRRANIDSASAEELAEAAAVIRG